MTQTELMRESFRHSQEMSELLQKQEELQERLSEEARAREQLALELHRAEGVCFYCFVLLCVFQMCMNSVSIGMFLQSRASIK